jgi:hypothetical protein
MIVPVAVLSATNAFASGWVEAPVDLPAWWDAFTLPVDVRERPAPKLKPPAPKEKPASVLFDLDAEVTLPPAEVAPAAKPVAAWVTALLSSPVFDQQKQLGGRAVPTNEVLAQLLGAIDDRGGKITSPALARAIRFSAMRLRGLLAVAQRILNVDGYAVLTRDEASDTIELDRILLCRQFDLVAREP